MYICQSIRRMSCKSIFLVLLSSVTMVTDVLSTVCDTVCECREEDAGLLVDCTTRMLTAVPADIPDNTAILKLSGNSIVNIEEKDLRDLDSLQFLYLDHNQIRSDMIDERAFQNLGQLLYLDLSHNRIWLDTTQMTSALRPLTELKWLDLANNNIDAIDQGLITVFDRLDTLTLTANALGCDCDLMWFKNWLLNTRYTPPIVNGAECYQPAELQRQQVAYASFCLGEGTCYTCDDVTDNEECTAVTTCSSSENGCQNVIRITNNIKRISKGCKQLEACLNNNDNNLDSCNEDGDTVCWHCCQGDLCNGPETAVVANGCKKHNTPNEYVYQYVWPRIPSDITMFTFKLRATNDGHVVLSAEPDSPVLVEIVLGGWNNQGSVLRSCKQCASLTTIATPNLLSPYEDTDFYVSFTDGLIEVGILGQVPFMSHQYSQDLTIRYIGISTGFGSTGDWTFCGFASNTQLLPTDTSHISSKHGDIRLRGGSNPTEGRVEIFYQGKWGNICVKNWDVVSASVACRQLGHVGALSIPSPTKYKDGSSSTLALVWLDDVTCSGNETKISECNYRGWGHHKCWHSQYATAVCSTKHIKGEISHKRMTRQATTGCPDGWDANEDYCYYISTDRVNYADAQITCQDMGAMLASIHSQEEQDFLTAKVLTVNARLWIGLNDMVNENYFVWTDGTDVDFHYWDEDEPNDMVNEDCVEMLRRRNDDDDYDDKGYDFIIGHWNDQECTDRIGYMCKMSRVPKTKPGQFTCAGKEDGLYPDPSVCSNYYTCANNGQTLILTPCDTGLVFNPYCSCCDFAYNYDCQGVSDFTCIGRDDGIYPDPEDCQAYFECYSGGNLGRTTCIEGTVFNPNCQCCDWPENYDCPKPLKCTDIPALGMADGSISNSQITASSFYPGQGGLHAWKGRLNSAEYWATQTENPSDPWIQVDLVDTITVAGMMTQGSAHAYQEWVTALKIQSGESENSLTYIMDGNGPKVFAANTDKDSVVEIVFPVPVSTRFLRIRPTEWNEWCSLRFEVLGCETAQIMYLGCFLDATERALPDNGISSSTMTHEVCFAHCLSGRFRYAGVQYSDQCFCGKDGTAYDIHGQRNEGECNYNCAGNAAQRCGGAWRMNIYDLSTVPTPSTTIRPTDPMITVSVPTKPQHCSAEVSDEGDKGLISWSRAEPDETKEVNCPYQKTTGELKVATRQCIWDENEGAQWEAANVDECPTDTEVLQELADEEITEDNIDEVSEMLAVVTSNPSALNDDDVTDAVVTLEHISQSIDTLNPSASPDILTNVLVTFNHMVNVPTGELEQSQQTEKTSTRILKTIDDFALGVQLGSTTSIIENTQVVDVAVVTVDNTNVDSDILFRSVGSNNGNYQPELYLNLTSGFKIKDNKGILQASVLLPNSLLREVADDLDRCQFVMYQDTTFFEVIDIGGPNSTQEVSPCTVAASDNSLQPTNCNDEDNNQDGGDEDNDVITILNSVVISASVGDLEVTNLQEPATIQLRNINPDAFNPRCVFWDVTMKDGTGGWSQDGCRVNNEQSTKSLTVCECDHLTNFAMIMDVYKDGSKLSRGHTIALSVISYIGCAVSFVALLLTLLTYTLCGRDKRRPKKKDNRSGRRDKRTKILLNLVVSLMLVNVFFICGSLVADYDGPGPLCITLAIILHYFLLSAMVWMALEAFDMYMALVKVFESYYSHYLLKMCIIGWGLPVVAIAFTAGFDIQHYGYHSGLCWLSTIPFYAAFLAPVCLILLFNTFVFIMVTKQLCQLRQRKITKSDNFDLAAQLRASFSITFLLGLTWILAIFAVGSADLIVSYLFAIVNSLQGFSLFFFQCVLNPDIRKRWYRTCCPKCAPPEEQAYPSNDGTTRRITAHQKISTTSTTAPLTQGTVSSRVSQFESGHYSNTYDNGNSQARSYSNDNTYDYPAPPSHYETITDPIPSRTTRT